MGTAKEAYRNVEQGTKRVLRDQDGHDAKDDIGNAGDQIRKEMGNAGDRARESIQRGQREMTKPSDRDRTDRR